MLTLKRAMWTYDLLLSGPYENSAFIVVKLRTWNSMLNLMAVLLVVSVSITYFNIGCFICLPNSIYCSIFDKIVSSIIIIICYEYFVIKLFIFGIVYSR